MTMKFLVCKKMDGEGCHYTIGCGMHFSFVEAESLNDAIEKAIWPDGRQEMSSLEGEMSLDSIVVVPAENAVIVDVAANKRSIAEHRKMKETTEAEARERAEMHRLQEKYLK
jgi:hypothetical protein